MSPLPQTRQSYAFCTTSIGNKSVATSSSVSTICKATKKNMVLMMDTIRFHLMGHAMYKSFRVSVIGVTVC